MSKEHQVLMKVDMIKPMELDPIKIKNKQNNWDLLK
jgi:hypothetical protein